MFAVAASYGPDDASPVRRSAEACAGKFLDVSLAGHADAAKAVAAERPQIFIDLVAHTTGTRYVCCSLGRVRYTTGCFLTELSLQYLVWPSSRNGNCMVTNDSTFDRYVRTCVLLLTAT